MNGTCVILLRSSLKIVSNLRMSQNTTIEYNIHGQPFQIKGAKSGPKPLPNLRRQIVPIRMNQHEKEVARRNAESRGLSLSEYIRSLIYADCIYTKSIDY